MSTPSIVTSIDIINLSHALKDICEVNCKTPECLNQTLKILLQYNLIKLNQYLSRRTKNTRNIQKNRKTRIKIFYHSSCQNRGNEKFKRLPGKNNFSPFFSFYIY